MLFPSIQTISPPSQAVAGTPGASGVALLAPAGTAVGSHQNLYIADTSNSRIQRWSPVATSGVTLAGDSNGVLGMSDTRLNYPDGLTINSNETRFYVSDSGNQRVQRFERA